MTIWTERRLGELLIEREKAKGGQPYQASTGNRPLPVEESPPSTLTEQKKAQGNRGQGSPSLRGNTALPPKEPSTPLPPTLADLGIGKMQAHRLQCAASVPEEVLQKHIIETKAEPDGELTSAGVQRLVEKPHVSHNTGEVEWYTPTKYIEAARAVMGGIDVDPASCEKANSTVRASTYYTEADNGLIKGWPGRVWLNPPYSSSLVSAFGKALTEKVASRETTEAILLVNNATETEWGQGVQSRADMVCFPSKRIKFLSPDGEKGAPLQGQMVLYFGANTERFKDVFSGLGIVWGKPLSTTHR